MGVARQVAELYQIKVNALLDRVEDPRQTLDWGIDGVGDVVDKISAQTASPGGAASTE